MNRKTVTEADAAVRAAETALADAQGRQDHAASTLGAARATLTEAIREEEEAADHAAASATGAASRKLAGAVDHRQMCAGIVGSHERRLRAAQAAVAAAEAALRAAQDGAYRARVAAEERALLGEAEAAQDCLKEAARKIVALGERFERYRAETRREGPKWDPGLGAGVQMLAGMLLERWIRDAETPLGGLSLDPLEDLAGALRRCLGAWPVLEEAETGTREEEAA